MSSLASYVQQRDDEFYVGDSRVTAHTVVANWKRGLSPAEIHAAFPTLSVAAIDNVLAYYVEHQEEFDAHFQRTAAILEANQTAMETQRPEFFAEMRGRLAAHRAQRDAAGHDQPQP